MKPDWIKVEMFSQRAWLERHRYDWYLLPKEERIIDEGKASMSEMKDVIKCRMEEKSGCALA